MEMISGMGEVISAFMSGDSFNVQSAMRGNPGIWPLGLIATLVGGALMAFIYRAVPLIERHLEPTVMVVAYLAIGYIIFSGVVQRFFLSGQPPWSTTIPPFLFLIMAWVGCSYNVKLRTHLAFAEFRKSAPRTVQLFLLLFDALLWLGFAWIVVVTTTQETVRAAANFSIMLGTDNVMQWWFLGTVPVAFILLTARVMENAVKDLKKFRNGDEMIEAAVIGGDT
ncbi:MAG: TRAP transporter small permease subunit [Pseudomonadota bacterium]